MSDSVSLPSRYSTSDRRCFGFSTARERWPIIVTGVIDDVHRSVLTTKDEKACQEGKKIIEELGKLKYEILHDRAILALTNDGQSDIKSYEREMAGLSTFKWLSLPWLFSECYLYRRISTLFTMTEHWSDYDPFLRQKLNVFKVSKEAVFKMAERYPDLIQRVEELGNKEWERLDEASRIEFQRIFEEVAIISLWGNETDLSLLANVGSEEIRKLQRAKLGNKAEGNILVNDCKGIFDALLKEKVKGKEERRIDIVLDNAGFELFSDMILASVLIKSGLATRVVLHAKCIPWFVSDTTKHDFVVLLNILARPEDYYCTPTDDEIHTGVRTPKLNEEEIKGLRKLFDSWAGMHANKLIEVQDNRFWSECSDFWEMKNWNKPLYKELKTSDLVIFKGDLNYRKLTGDRMWNIDTPFSQALGSLGSNSGIRLTAIRTCKSDVCVGLKSEEEERLALAEGNNDTRRWAWKGQWGLIQFHDGKLSESTPN